MPGLHSRHCLYQNNNKNPTQTETIQTINYNLYCCFFVLRNLPNIDDSTQLYILCIEKKVFCFFYIPFHLFSDSCQISVLRPSTLHVMKPPYTPFIDPLCRNKSEMNGRDIRERESERERDMYKVKARDVGRDRERKEGCGDKV